jgi:hypothetical protein
MLLERSSNYIALVRLILIDADVVVLPASKSEAKRESGAAPTGAYSGAAPATVSGELLSSSVSLRR